MKGHSSDPVDLELLDPVTVLAFADEDRDLEKFSPGIELAKGVLGVGSRSSVIDFEGTWSVGPEERLQDLLRLVLAGIRSVGHDRDLQVVGEPCGKTFRIPFGQVL